MDEQDLSFFDPRADWSIVQRGLPHWRQSSCVSFVTWRLADSLPVAVLQQLDRESQTVLGREGLDFHADWKAALAQREPGFRSRVHRKLFVLRDKFLDAGCGACQLAQKDCAQVVLDSLLYFDTDRYYLTDAVIMPNHVHFMAGFADENLMLKQCKDWKRYTARRINTMLGVRGEFWQVDQFDHLVRGPDQFEYYRRYIAENPRKANLDRSRFIHFQKRVSL